MQLDIVSVLSSLVSARDVSAPSSSSNISFGQYKVIRNGTVASCKLANIPVAKTSLFIIANIGLQALLTRVHDSIEQLFGVLVQCQPHWVSKNKCGDIQDVFIANLAASKANWLDILHLGASGSFLRVAK